MNRNLNPQQFNTRNDIGKPPKPAPVATTPKPPKPLVTSTNPATWKDNDPYSHSPPPVPPISVRGATI